MLVRNHALGVSTTELENAKQTILVGRVLLLRELTWRWHPFWKSLMAVGFCHGVGTRKLGCSFASANTCVNSLKRISSCEFGETVIQRFCSKREKEGRNFSVEVKKLQAF